MRRNIETIIKGHNPLKYVVKVEVDEARRQAEVFTDNPNTEVKGRQLIHYQKFIFMRDLDSLRDFYMLQELPNRIRKKKDYEKKYRKEYESHIARIEELKQDAHLKERKKDFTQRLKESGKDLGTLIAEYHDPQHTTEWHAGMVRENDMLVEETAARTEELSRLNAEKKRIEDNLEKLENAVRSAEDAVKGRFPEEVGDRPQAPVGSIISMMEFRERLNLFNKTLRKEDEIKLVKLDTMEAEWGEHTRIRYGYTYMLETGAPFKRLKDFLREHVYPLNSPTDRALELFQAPRLEECFYISTGVRNFKGYLNYSKPHKFTYDIETTNSHPAEYVCQACGKTHRVRGVNSVVSECETCGSTQLEHRDVGQVYIMAMKDNRGFKKVTVVPESGEPNKVDEDKEREMLKDFFRIVPELKPSMHIGYNKENFDDDFVLYRAMRLGINLKPPCCPKCNSGEEIRNYYDRHYKGFELPRRMLEEKDRIYVCQDEECGFAVSKERIHDPSVPLSDFVTAMKDACPDCGSSLVKGNAAYGCASWRSGCGHRVPLPEAEYPFEMIRAYVPSTAVRDKGIYKNKYQASLKIGAEVERYHKTVIYGSNSIDPYFEVRAMKAKNSSIKSAGLKYISGFKPLKSRTNRMYVEGSRIYRMWAENRSFIISPDSTYMEVPDGYGPEEFLAIVNDPDRLRENRHLMDGSFRGVLKVLPEPVVELQEEDDINGLEDLLMPFGEDEDVPGGLYESTEDVRESDREFVDGRFGLVDKTEYFSSYCGSFRLTTGAEIVEAYALDDVLDTEPVEAHYMKSHFIRNQNYPTGFERFSTMGTASAWNLLTMSYAYSNHVAFAHRVPQDLRVGGLSRSFIIGFARLIQKADFSSLYPAIQLAHSVFPKFAPYLAEFLLFYYNNRMYYNKRKKINDIEDYDLRYNKTLGAMVEDGNWHEYLESFERWYAEGDRDKVKAFITEYYLSADNIQMTSKVDINALFGSLGSGVFLNADMFCAGRITSSGRQYLRSVLHFFRQLGAVPLVCDSVSASTPVYVKNADGMVGVREIWELFDESNAVDGGLRDVGRKPYLVLSSSGWAVCDYVYRHGTHKRMTVVGTGRGSIEVTEDHSLFSGGHQVKPADLSPGHPLDFYDMKGLEYASAGAGAIRDRAYYLLGYALPFLKTEPRVREDGVQRLATFRVPCGYAHNELMSRAYHSAMGRLHVTDSSEAGYYRVTATGSGFYPHMAHICELVGGRTRISDELLNAPAAYLSDFAAGLRDALSGWSIDGGPSLTINRATLAALQLIHHRCGMPMPAGLPSLDGGDEVDCLHDYHADGQYVYDISTHDGTFVAGVGGFVAKNTDGVNFAMPETVDKDVYLRPLPAPIPLSELEYKGERGVQAIIGRFNDEYLARLGYMKLSDDGRWVNQIQSSRKNYVCQEEDGKVKLIGNSFKCSTMPPFIEEFITKRVPEVLKSESLVMLKEEYDRMHERIVGRNLTLAEVVKSKKVKSSKEEYLKRGYTKRIAADGSFVEKAKMAHMELVIAHGLVPSLGDSIYYINNGNKATDGDSAMVNDVEMVEMKAYSCRRCGKVHKMEAGQAPPSVCGTAKKLDMGKLMAEVLERASAGRPMTKSITDRLRFLGPVETQVLMAASSRDSALVEELMGPYLGMDSVVCDYDVFDEIALFKCACGKKHEVPVGEADGFTCKCGGTPVREMYPRKTERFCSYYVDARDLEREPGRHVPYNVPAYLESFNKKFSTLLVLFPKHVRNHVIRGVDDPFVPIPVDTLEMSVEELDKVDDIFTMEDKEVDFWNDLNEEHPYIMNPLAIFPHVNNPRGFRRWDNFNEYYDSIAPRYLERGIVLKRDRDWSDPGEYYMRQECDERICFYRREAEGPDTLVSVVDAHTKEKIQA